MSQEVDLHKVFEKLVQIEDSMITRDELSGFLETHEILSNEKTMNQIVSSQRDIESGRFRQIKSVKDF